MVGRNVSLAPKTVRAIARRHEVGALDSVPYEKSR
jgi:hypothetical protein